MQQIYQCILTVVILTSCQLAVANDALNVTRLSQQLTPFLNCLSSERETLSLTAELSISEGDKTHEVSLSLERFDSESFNLSIKHKDYWFKLQRRADWTAMCLPLHNVVYLGEGEVSGNDTVKPQGILKRLISQGSMASVYLPMMSNANPQVSALLLKNLLNLKYDEMETTYSISEDLNFQFEDNQDSLALNIGKSAVRIELHDGLSDFDNTFHADGLSVTKLDRTQLETSLSRGFRRLLEVLAPSPLLTSPATENRQVPHGELRWIDGHRVVLLQGSPEEIGYAHGQLLKTEAHRCVDSVLHMFGIVQTVRTGRWFQDDLKQAYHRLDPHIPQDHKTETIALAESIGWDPELAQLVNVFPELFHCSGFAVFGNATKTGKLYHGRVLDYMTTIGLQDSATTFIIAVDGKIPFATVGYGGFIGSVSGMNASGISLGEMGGGGEGKWDGVPMTTLMRRALEECSSLKQVKALWTDSPRTCEYYYVFADGKTNEAVGVAATPEAIEFVEPGQYHPLLGDGIEDSVVLSAGSRLQTLRSRVQEHHGQIDEEIGKWLMSRPVAMQSNLHNVLFVPEDSVLFVANADHKHPAAERPYVRLDLQELLQSMNVKLSKAAAIKSE